MIVAMVNYFFKLFSGRVNSCFQLPVIATSQLLPLHSHLLHSFIFFLHVYFKGIHCIQIRSLPFTRVVSIGQGFRSVCPFIEKMKVMITNAYITCVQTC